MIFKNVRTGQKVKLFAYCYNKDKLIKSIEIRSKEEYFKIRDEWEGPPHINTGRACELKVIPI